MLLPHFAQKPRFPGADLVRPARLGPEPGSVVRSLATPLEPASAAAVSQMAAPSLPPAAPKVEQKVDITAPLTVTVQGDVRDPAELARQLFPFMEQQQRDIAQQLQSRKLYDEPHI